MRVATLFVGTLAKAQTSLDTLNAPSKYRGVLLTVGRYTSPCGTFILQYIIPGKVEERDMPPSFCSPLYTGRGELH